MRGTRTSGLLAIAVAALALTGCGDPKKAIAEADVAGGEKLEEYSRNISETVDLVANPDLVQRFCKNALGATCPADITETLKANGYAGGGTGVDLAQAFVVMLADTKDGEPDLSSSDEDYLFAAYRVALGRDPDEAGAADNLTFIQDTGNRKQMLRSLLESDEFKNQG
jgi:Domain of unknown function (DUF4214)